MLLTLASTRVVSFPRHAHPGVAGVGVPGWAAHFRRPVPRLALQVVGRPFPWFENHLNQTDHSQALLCRTRPDLATRWQQRRGTDL